MAKVNIVGIVGSPRHHSNTEVMVREALEGAKEAGDVETQLLLLAGKKINPCLSCFKCNEKRDFCIFRFKDDMHEVYEKYLAADGLIIGSPVYHLSISGILKNAIDRLGQGLNSKYRATGRPWFAKVGGVLTQGMGRFGGQEYTLQFLVSHLLLMNNMVVAPGKGDAIGAIGSFNNQAIRQVGVIAEYDVEALPQARALGKRVAELTRIVRTGVETLKDELPEEYNKYLLQRQAITDYARATQKWESKQGKGLSR